MRNYIVVDKAIAKQTIRKMYKYMLSKGLFYYLEIKEIKGSPNLCKIVASA